MWKKFAVIGTVVCGLGLVFASSARAGGDGYDEAVPAPTPAPRYRYAPPPPPPPVVFYAPPPPVVVYPAYGYYAPRVRVIGRYHRAFVRRPFCRPWRGR